MAIIKTMKENAEDAAASNLLLPNAFEIICSWK
jgi:hypothetical protein